MSVNGNCAMARLRLHRRKENGMTFTWRLLFLILALICFLIAAFQAVLAPSARVQFVPLGYAFLVAAWLA